MKIKNGFDSKTIAEPCHISMYQKKLPWQQPTIDSINQYFVKEPSRIENLLANKPLVAQESSMKTELSIEVHVLHVFKPEEIRPA